MAKIVRSLFLLSLLITSSLSTITAEPCSTHQFPNHKTFAACNDLPVLNSTIYWSYFPSNGTVDLAFRATLLGDSGWAAWAINPSSKGMVGSQALIAFQRSDGTMTVYTSPIKGYDTHLEQGNLTFPVYALSAIREDKEMTIFASIGLPKNVTTVNQLWQQGPVHGNKPGMHSMAGPYLKSYGTLDFLSGKVEVATSRIPLSPLKIGHGMLNAISWGILIPTGTIVARNLKAFDPAWFHGHRVLQTLGALGAVAGFGTGYAVAVGSNSHKGHKCIGWTLMALLVLQMVVAFGLRPKKDAKYRWLWDLFHTVLGYSMIILANVNVFKGFAIMAPPVIWKHAFIGILSTVVFVGVAAAAFTYWNDKRTRALKTTQVAEEGTV